MNPVDELIDYMLFNINKQDRDSYSTYLHAFKPKDMIKFGLTDISTQQYVKDCLEGEIPMCNCVIYYNDFTNELIIKVKLDRIRRN